VDRLAYRAPGVGNLHPADAALNLPVERHSHGLRKLCSLEAPRGSFDGAIDAIDAPAGMHRVTYAYTRHLLYVAAQGDCVDGLTAVLPCQWSYGELAVPLARALPQDPVYAEWIQMFGNDEYDGLVGETTALLDRLADPSDDERMRTLSRIFDTSTDFEVRFWNMAYGGLDD
jgi:hypothetical protein